MLSFVFPGQGSQFVGMGKAFYQQYAFIREIFAEADQALAFSLTELIFEGPEEELKKTVNAQPAILTVSVAMHEMLKREGYKPDVVAGHSLGEYSALVAAGALNFSDAVRLVRLRGRFMQEAVPLGQGGMLAVLGLSRQQVVEGCRQAAAFGVVEAANFNCPGQVVVAGESQALERAGELFKQLGARRCIPLQVSAPFHSSLMVPAGARLAPELEKVEVKDPDIPVIANVSADYVKTAAGVRDALIKQVSSPVLWEQSVLRMIEGGAKILLEVGPGQVLTGLIRKISKNVTGASFNDQTEPAAIYNLLKEAV
ncbi:[acyl-carrier-protein] S-malonyltransferase [Desulfotomaculum arcticum]|uniref:Malonyl CoA-acyl carrier protein transacylase n=1 Tax=Desulfotruncus arcticus DSM 17038 TaxID=1121424 RepID=A0A1I2RHG2_9FIRM|nr:ACP S-malonyltransferase [Desulfotruncus arcticus]SFG39543.1 [acyl-carrier-protein] S-malonyltransferase [Desulfotomaculum arcticum] [Desulfotruncus arcticus DSM 17038]